MAARRAAMARVALEAQPAIGMSSMHLMLSVKPTPVPGQKRTHVTHSDVEAAVRVLRAAANDEQLRERLQRALASPCSPPQQQPPLDSSDDSGSGLCPLCATKPLLRFESSGCTVGQTTVAHERV